LQVIDSQASNPCARYHLCGSDLLTLESVEYNEMRRPQSKIHEQQCPQIALLRLPSQIRDNENSLLGLSHVAGLYLDAEVFCIFLPLVPVSENLEQIIFFVLIIFEANSRPVAFCTQRLTTENAPFPSSSFNS